MDMRHRVTVYKFGARWSWRCLEPNSVCDQGGSHRKWPATVASALAHNYENSGRDMGTYKPTRDLAWHKGVHYWSVHDGYPRHTHSLNGDLTIAPDDPSPHFSHSGPFTSPKSKADYKPGQKSPAAELLGRGLRGREVERIGKMADWLGALVKAYQTDLSPAERRDVGDAEHALRRLAGRIDREEIGNA